MNISNAVNLKIFMLIICFHMCGCAAADSKYDIDCFKQFNILNKMETSALTDLRSLGNLCAIYIIAERYEVKNDGRFVSFYEEAAANGSVIALDKLGSVYRFGAGVDIDIE